ncbi:54S ribosomal protein L6 mitochondrial [Thecaphora frezii]
MALSSGSRISTMLIAGGRACLAHGHAAAGTETSVPLAMLGHSIRHSHIGSAPLYLPTSTTLEIKPFPPHPNPSRPLSSSLRYARSAIVRGPQGETVVPLPECIDLNLEAPKAPAAGSSTSADELEPSKLTLCVKDASVKSQRSFWGLTRALLANAITGVSEGHSVALRLVGVGYRAAVEQDPLPRSSKLQSALASGRTFFLNDEQKAWEIQRQQRMEQEAAKAGPPMRLNIRLGYSHPVLMPVPYGITATTPQPNRILLRGADKEQLGLFASQIRSWRKPEPYKGKGVFVDDETIRLRTPKKK